MPSYQHATVTVGTSAVNLIPNLYVSGGAVIQNNTTGILYVGGAGVTADATATGGVKIAAAASLQIPGSADQARDLWAIAVTSGPVSFLLA